MLNPLGIRTGISAFVDDVDDLFGGDDTEGRPTSEPPEPAVDYHTLFDEDPPVKAVIGSGLNGVEQVLRQPSLVEDAADPRFPAFQQAWREGGGVEDLLGDEPFRLKARIAGNGGDNWRPDVAKVQVLLNKAGYHNIASEEGPNGYHSTALDQDIRRFQRANKLTVDGKLSPDGETIRTLERALSPKLKTPAQADMPPLADRQDKPETGSAPAMSGDGTGEPPPVKLPPGRKLFQAPDWKSEKMFEELVGSVFKDEGGYSNNKDDRGGETNFGITAGILKKYQEAYGGLGINGVEIEPGALTKQQAKEIYRNEFFYGQRMNELTNPAIATAILDATVLHGPGTAWGLLQESINAIDKSNSLVVDRVGGTSTIRKLNSLSPENVRRLIDKNDEIRRDRIEKIIKSSPSQKQFGGGWSNRLSMVKKRAMEYANNDAPS